MLIKTFWTIVIKIIGLWLLFNCISILPQFYSTLSFINGSLDTASLATVWLVLCAAIMIYCIVIRLFLFKSQWIIDKLQLAHHFTEERIELNVKATTVLTIASIIIGGLIIVESIPHFCEGLFRFFQQKLLFKEYGDANWLIYHFIKIIIGYLLLTNGGQIAKYIDKN